MVKLAIQEDMLPGQTLLEKFDYARRLGFHGVELWTGDLDVKMHDIVAAVEATGVVISAVNHGNRDGLLRVNPFERDRAASELRRSLTDAADLDAAGVLFVPHYGVPSIPDLTPFLPAEGLETELLIAHLRTLEDYAAAMGVELYIQAVSPEVSHFINHVEQAAAIARRRNRPSVRIAASLYHMQLVGEDTGNALREAKDVLRYLHLSDSERKLPGQGGFDFSTVGAALREMEFSGWVTLECGEPGFNHAHTSRWLAGLPESLRVLRTAGIID